MGAALRQEIVVALDEAIRRERQRLALRAEINLHLFLRTFAWPVLMPGTRFQDNWHIGAVCEHLEAVHSGEIKRLIINIPFRSLKSTIISQTFPAWEWTTIPSLRYLTASYAKDLATRDAVLSRRIIESDAYQEAWGSKFSMTSDQNVKSRYDNSRGGSRVITATEAAGTGFGGGRLIIDDPVSAMDANSMAAIEASIDWWKGTASTRLDNPEEDAIIVTHQRLSPQDLTGHILSEEPEGWELLILPMRYSPKIVVATSLGLFDPRTKEGELLHPARLSEKTVKEMENRLGTYHTAAQLQQNPAARGGQVFSSTTFRRFQLPPHLVRRAVFVDTAQKKGEHNDYSVLLLAGLGNDGRVYALDVDRGRWEAPELKRRARDFWNKHLSYDFKTSCMLEGMYIEDKVSGTGLIQEILHDGGIPAVPVPRVKDKLTRFYDVQSYFEAGLFCVPTDADWAHEFCKEFDLITKNDTHPFDDQVDTGVDAVETFLGQGSASMFDAT